jgi:pimeloyl-ACP methyl ester carboxylesterase
VAITLRVLRFSPIRLGSDPGAYVCARWSAGGMTNPTSVIFIHGLWLHASSWQPWSDLFAREGYQPLMPGWPGDSTTVAESRDNPESVADYGVDDVVDHYAAIIAELPTRPILIGHSFGGMVAQKLLAQDLAVAAVAIDAAQIKGVLPLPLSALRSTLPAFKNPANKHKAVTLTAEQFRYAFGNALSQEESDALYQRWTVPAPGRPLFEAAAANFNPHASTKVDTRNNSRGPLLLVSGGKDHTVPETVVRATLAQYRHSSAVTDILDFPDRGHSLTIDSGWPQVAAAALDWLRRQSL